MKAFNPELLTGVPPEHHSLAKIILFTLSQKLRVYDFFEVDGGKVVLSDDLRQDVNTIVRILIDNNVIVADYEGTIRLSPMQPLFAGESVSNPLDAESIRRYFKHSYLLNTYSLEIAGKMGDVKTCQRNLEFVQEEYHELFENVTNDVLEAAAMKYIESCVQQDRFILDCDNFIWNGKSKLCEFVEMVIDEGIREDTIKPGQAQDWTEE